MLRVGLPRGRGDYCFEDRQSPAMRDAKLVTGGALRPWAFDLMAGACLVVFFACVFAL